MLISENFTQITGHAFAPRPNLGPLSTFLETPNQSQIELISTTHKQKSRLWKEQETFTTAIKKINS